MEFKHQLGLGAAAGIAIDRAQHTRAFAQYGQMIENQINHDCYTLGQTGTLPPVNPPPSPPGRTRSPLLAALLGALGTGAACGLVICALIILITAVGGGHVGQGILGGIFFGFVTAVVTTLVPGAFVALLLQRRAAAKQYAAQAHEILMYVHEQREAIRRDLEVGRIDAHAAAQEVSALLPS